MRTDTELAELIEERQTEIEIRDSAAAKATELSAAIGSELAIRGTERFETQNWTVTITKPQTREALDEHLLLEAGVTVDQIQKGKKVSTIAGSVRVTRRA